MPPRYAYWTILIDGKPTAFRARDKEELLPTFHQLQRKSSDIVMKWFARGKLWDTPEQAQWALRNMDRPREKRGREWRPGGEHKDPRDRFKRRPHDPRNANVGGPPARDRQTPPSGEPRAPRAFKKPHTSDRRGQGASKGSWAPRTSGNGPRKDARAPFKKPKKDRG